jgi:hypothetical protein
VLFVRIWRRGITFGGTKTIHNREELVTTGGAALIGCAFVGLRIGLAGHGGSPGILEYLRAQHPLQTGLGRHLHGLWESLRFAWGFVLVAVIALLGTPVPIRILGLGLIAATAAMSVLVADDLSRSMIVLMPVAMEGLVRWAPLSVTWRRTLPVAAIASLIIPAHHVVTNFVAPIRNSYAVMQLARRPKEVLAAENWTALGSEHLGKGDRDGARQCVDIALGLNPLAADAYNLRGYIAAQDENWQAALSDFARACDLSPTTPSFWFNQAHAAARVGDPAAFARSLAVAKRLAPTGSELALSIAQLEKTVRSVRDSKAAP